MADTRETAVVYTETVVHAPPQQYAADAPYQLAIVTFADGSRRTVRMVAESAEERAQVGDDVEFVEERNGVAYYRKTGRRV